MNKYQLWNKPHIFPGSRRDTKQGERLTIYRHLIKEMARYER